jgi:hypothetical protein
MRFYIAALILALSFGAASAKDVTVTLNDNEQKVMVNLLDLAVKAGGLNAAESAAYFAKKFAGVLPPAVTPPAAPKVEEKKDEKKN